MNILDSVDNIIPHLYLTNWKSSNDPNIMERYKIKGVVTLEMMDKPQQTIMYYKQHNIQNLHIRINDTPQEEISKYFDVTYKFINDLINKNENVLVHCRAGVSRSTSIIINYLLQKKYENFFLESTPKQTVDDIIMFVRSKRSIINPNQGFVNQLYSQAYKYSQISLWNLSMDDVLPSGNLRNNLTSIIIFCKNSCNIELYKKLAEKLAHKSIKTYIINGLAKFQQYSSNDDPFIVGLFKGKFFSEYGLNPRDINNYRTYEDFIQYALELGTDVKINYEQDEQDE